MKFWKNYVFLEQAGGGSGGGGGTPPGKNEGDDDGKGEQDNKNKVDYDSFTKVLDQKKATDAKNKELLKKLQERDEKDKEIERKRLLEKEEFKTLYEAEKQKREDAENGLSEVNKARLSDFRQAAFLNALPNKLQKYDYISHAKLSEIVINEENGELDKVSVKKVVDDFVTSFPELLQKPNNVKLPNDAPGGGSDKISYDEWCKLPVKEKKLRIKDVKE